MLSKLLNKKKNWFTLIELLLVCSAFAILVSGVIIAINRAYSFMNDTKLRIKATNFAREWVEMMFNVRDTNWRRHSWERDTYWLNVWTWSSNFQEWLYVLKEWITESGDKSFYADKLNITDIECRGCSVNYERFYTNETFRERINLYTWAEIQFTWDYNYMEYVDGEREPQVWRIQDLLFNEAKFYRVVRVFGIYCKTAGRPDIVVDSRNCDKTSAPKEMRFCVKVFYTNGSVRGSSELCSIMTNFME